MILVFNLVVFGVLATAFWEIVAEYRAQWHRSPTAIPLEGLAANPLPCQQLPPARRLSKGVGRNRNGKKTKCAVLSKPR